MSRNNFTVSNLYPFGILGIITYIFAATLSRKTYSRAMSGFSTLNALRYAMLLYYSDYHTLFVGNGYH